MAGDIRARGSCVRPYPRPVLQSESGLARADCLNVLSAANDMPGPGRKVTRTGPERLRGLPVLERIPSYRSGSEHVIRVLGHGFGHAGCPRTDTYILAAPKRKHPKHTCSSTLRFHSSFEILLWLLINPPSFGTIRFHTMDPGLSSWSLVAPFPGLPSGAGCLETARTTTFGDTFHAEASHCCYRVPCDFSLVSFLFSV